jgi:hypothetical protein
MRPTVVGPHRGSCRRRRSKVELLGLMALAWACSEARAQPTYVAAGVPANKPAGVDSFVVTSDNQIVWDDQYANQLRAFPGSVVDVVMQQCFGGGFAPNMQASLGGVKDDTFTAASNWNEVAFSDVSHGRLGLQSLTRLDNFTRAWVDSFPGTSGCTSITRMRPTGTPRRGSFRTRSPRAVASRGR